jgi:hypothetical protein
VKAIKTVEQFDPRIPTLGWLVISWIEAWLIQPDGDNAGQPYRMTREQRNFVLWFYALDERGRWKYRRALLRRSKGWGKSPFLAALCIVELVGPVMFAGWAAETVRVGWDDVPVPLGQARPNAWVVLAGVSETQTANTYDSIRGMVTPALIAEYEMDVGMTRIYAKNGAKLHPITANASTQEGARPSFAVMDEVHHWTPTNGGKALAKVVRRNLAKVRGRSVVTTNAHAPAQDTVARDYYDAHLAQAEGRTRRKDLLYDSQEAPVLSHEEMATESILREALKCAYGDSWWVDLDDLISEIYSPDTPPEDSCRFYLNQIVDAADVWILAAQFDANRRPDLRPLRTMPHGQWKRADTVCLGFDGARTDDSTALVAVRVEDGAIFLLGLWERPPGADGNGWEVPRELVRGAVDEAFATLNVVGFYSDVAEWETDVDDWRDRYGERLLIGASTKHKVAWDMRGHQADTTRAAESLHRSISDNDLPHNYGPESPVRRHFLNARRRPGRWGVTFGKESRESPHKVDIVAAVLLARLARTHALGKGVLASTAPGTLQRYPTRTIRRPLGR